MTTVEIVHMTRLIKTNPKEEGMKDQNTHVKDRPSTGNCSKLPRNPRKKGLG